MKSKSKFRYLFWALCTLMFLLIVPAMVLMGHEAANIEGEHPLWFMIAFMMIFIPSFIAIVARLVYKDAKKRGMDPWLWATVAVFVPNLVGVIIYLIIRNTIKSSCTNCGKPLQKDFKLCPYCGHPQEETCEKCNEKVDPNWKVCPHCAHPLKN